MARRSQGANRTDAELFAAGSQGDRQAVDELLRRHQSMVWAVCRRLCGDDESANDATQNALIRIVRGLPSFEGRSKPSTWIYRIAANAAMDELRARARRPRPTDLVGDPDIETVPPGDDAVGDRMILDPALRELPEEFRLVVVLRDLVDLEYTEIADLLDIPVGTVRSRLSRARRQLYRALGDVGATRTGNLPSPSPRHTDGVDIGDRSS